MKNSIILAAAVCVALAACTKESASIVETEIGTFTINVLSSESSVETKSLTAYKTSQTYESQVNKTQILVFDESGAINYYKDLGTSTSGTVSTTSGKKTVWAVVNGPDLSKIGTIDALKATALDLSANSTTASAGFVMSGSASCEVSASTNKTCSINVSRLAARVALMSITNNLPESYGSLTVERVFLANVVGNQSIDGSASPSTWYNKEGRADESTRSSDHIINGSTYKASCPGLTFKALSKTINHGSSDQPSTPYLFYTYANSSTTAPSGFSSTFSAQRSVLVVAATVSGTLYYYPVVLDDAVIARNTSYTVSLSITGLGSTDPNKSVDKGGINANITVNDWATGATYEETI